MHQFIFAVLGTILTMLWGLGFSVLSDRFDNGAPARTHTVASLWFLGQFAILFLAISLGA
jgi:hypothetical protein